MLTRSRRRRRRRQQLAKIIDTDPYYWTQDNGAGAPIHFATTYKQLDMVHHILNNGGLVNQRDKKGFTALHRAAYLAHYEGYLEIYEYLLSRGADPAIKSEDYDPYLNPGRKLPVDVAVDEGDTRAKLVALEKKYAGTAKEPEPHTDVGDWWALYDYGLDVVSKWPKTHKPEYPEEAKRARDAADRAREKKEHKARQAAIARGEVVAPAVAAAPKDTPVAFLFPGQGSQAVGMAKTLAADIPAVATMFEKAKEILGYDLLDVCVNGPKSKLDDTVYSQVSK